MPCPILGVTPGGGGGTILDYTDLSTLLAASGTAGARAQLLTAGGDAIGMWRYSGVLSKWLPDGDFTVTAAGTDTAIGAAVAMGVGGLPSFASGYVFAEGDAAYFPMLPAGIVGADFHTVQIEFHGTVIAGTPAVGETSYAFGGIAGDSGSVRHESAGMTITESAASYFLSVGLYYGIGGNSPTSSVTGVGAVSIPEFHSSLIVQRAVGDANTAGLAAVAESDADRNTGRSASISAANAGLTDAGVIKGPCFSVYGAPTGHGLQFKIESMSFHLREV